MTKKPKQPTQEEKRKFIIETARELYLKKSKRQRRRFFKWQRSNNWDVKEVFTHCIEEAMYFWNEIEKNEKHFPPTSSSSQKRRG